MATTYHPLECELPMDDSPPIVTKPRSMTLASLSMWHKSEKARAIRRWLNTPVVIHEPHHQDLALEAEIFLPLILWMVYLTAAGAYTRLLCLWRIPYDCPPLTTMRAMNGISELYAKGATIFIFSRMGRNRILFKWYFYVINLVTICVFGSLGVVFPGLYLEVGNNFSVRDMIFLCSMVTAMAGVGAYHVRLAWRINAKYGVTYLAVLVMLIMFYVIKTLVLLDHATIHVHHAFLFWVLSWFCRYKPIPSQVSLAVCTGIFIQGVSVYGQTGEIVG